MLLRFEVANHRSIDDPVELSMIAVDEDRPAARSFDLLNEKVLTVAGIYGPNASGKSNVLQALSWLSMLVGTSLRSWNDALPRQPFKFGGGSAKPTVFEVDMTVGGVRYAYRVELDGRQVITESLHSFPERRPRSLFEREGPDIQFRRGLGGLSGTRELLTPTTLALSAAMRFDVPEVRSFGEALSGIGTQGAFTSRSFVERSLIKRIMLTGRTEDLFGELTTSPESPERADDRPLALALLRFVDLGIDDVEIVTDAGKRGGMSVRLVHKVVDQRISFDMNDESDGTRTWFELIGPTLYALQTGQTTLFDEIDASLHPRLSARLIELFQDPETNPLGAQLIFTSHDTSLLNHLNRDEVWLTEKGADGATALTALAEYGGDKVRRSVNLERAYLQGRFGAVPELDQRLLRQAIGLIREAY